MNYQTIEEIRKQYAKKLNTIFVIVGVTIFAMVFLALFSMSSGMGFLYIISIAFIAMIITIIALSISANKLEKQYKNAYKSYFVGQALNRTFTNIQYDHDKGITKEELAATGMMRLGSIYNSNDYVSAKYHDVSLRQADVDIKERYTDSKGNTYYITIFRGRWMVFEFPKTFSFRLQVIQKKFTAGKKAAKNKETGRNLKRISTESITFDREFMVFAEDDFEAYYLLDPAFIDHIEQLAASQKGKIMLCFKDNQLHVAVFDGKDAFEPPSPFKTIDETTETAKIEQEIKTITDYVDFLKLDHKLFSKQK